MISLSPIPPRSLTQVDIEQLVSVSKRDYSKTPAIHWVKLALANKLQFYRMSGDVDGLVGLEIHPSETEGATLWVSFIAGKGAVKFVKEIWDELHKIRKSIGAKRLGTMAAGQGLLHIYQKKLGIEPVAHLFQEEEK